MSSPSVSVLLVDPQSEALAETVRNEHPTLAVTTAVSDTAARAYLGAAAFDVVVVGASMPSDIARTLESLVEALGHATRVVAGAPALGLAAWVAQHLQVPPSPTASTPTATGEVSTSDQQAVLKQVGAELSHIAHALNNPLAVIDGNAQLALELAKALEVDASVISAIEDIQGGSQSLAALFSDLAALRARVDELIH